MSSPQAKVLEQVLFFFLFFFFFFLTIGLCKPLASKFITSPLFLTLYSELAKPLSSHPNSVSPQFWRRVVLKEDQSTSQLCSLSRLVRLCSKSFRLGFSSAWIKDFQMYRGTRDQIANIPWIIEKARGFQGHIYFCFTNCTKAFDCVVITHCGKFLRQWEYKTILPLSPEKPICGSRSKKLFHELYVEQLTGSKLGKELDIVTLFI